MAFEVSFQSFLLADLVALTFGAVAATAISKAWNRTMREAARQRGAFGALLDGCPDAVVQIDGAGTCIFASAASARLLGLTSAEFAGRSLLELAGDDRDAFQLALVRASTGQNGSEAVFQRSRPTGERSWLEARIGPIDPSGRMTVALRDISTRKTAELALRVANVELNKLAGSDSLTGLANRRRFDQTLDTEFRRASRGAKPLTLLLIDVDRFDIYNDRYGHRAGDACLKRIAEALRGVVTRPTDLAARFGGEEFALLLPGVDEQEGIAIADRIRSAVTELALPDGGNLGEDGVVTVSVGCTTLRPTPDNVRNGAAQLIADADRALHAAKQLGRNRTVTQGFDTESDDLSARLAGDDARLARVEVLRQRDAFQPSANLSRIARMTAVLLGMPTAFVAILDRSDVILVGHHGLDDGKLDLPYDLCAKVLGAKGPLVLPKAAIEAQAQDVATGQGWNFLAGAPLLSGGEQHPVGALWVADSQARETLDEPKRVLLSHLASLVMGDLDAEPRQSPVPAKVA